MNKEDQMSNVELYLQLLTTITGLDSRIQELELLNNEIHNKRIRSLLITKKQLTESLILVKQTL